MALAVLGIDTVFIAWLNEILVGSVEQAALQLGMSKVFVGIIIVAVIGNAAELKGSTGYFLCHESQLRKESIVS